MSERSFNLAWSRNSGDSDLAAFDGALRVGRVYQLSGAGLEAGKWSWTMQALVDGQRVGSETGVADDLDAAQRKVEGSYNAFRHRTAKDGP